MTSVFVPKETRFDEMRVAATAPVVKKYIQAGFKVLVETGAGNGASIADHDFQEAGAEIVRSFADGAQQADITVAVNPLTTSQIAHLKEGSSVISFVFPAQQEGILDEYCTRKVSVFAMESIPRITRAQKLDALSSQSNIAGYQAVLLAALHSPKIFPLMSTPAGTLAASRVVIMGAGVAGLQAVATAKRLGAIVEVSDVRPAVKEQVQSLGASFIEVPTDASMETAGGYAREATPEFLKKQAEITKDHLKRADAVITSALVPGKKAPVLITAETVSQMKRGTVIVDMAAEQGGNCELTKAGEITVEHGVIIVGTLNLPSLKPLHSSEMYSKNILNLLTDQMGKEKVFNWNFEDDVVKCALLTHDGVKREVTSAVDLAISKK